MGPVRQPQEALSSFRLRYAGYCMLWLLALGIPLLVLLAVAPSFTASSAPLLLLFLYIGLSLGSATAAIAGLGFVLGGLWARGAESSAPANRRLNQVKFTALAVLVVPVAVFLLYISVSGLLSGQVHVFGRNTKALASLSSEPAWFLGNVALWGVSGVYCLVAVARKLRSAYAA